jgi:hypothetical protein
MEVKDCALVFEAEPAFHLVHSFILAMAKLLSD